MVRAFVMVAEGGPHGRDAEPPEFEVRGGGQAWRLRARCRAFTAEPVLDEASK